MARLCPEPYAWAQRITTCICRIPILFATSTHGPCRSFLPEPRTPQTNGRRRPTALVTPRTIFGVPTDLHELRMGLRMGTMQAPRRQRCADAREPFWYVQARHHGGRVGGSLYSKLLPCNASISSSLLPRSSATTHVGANLASKFLYCSTPILRHTEKCCLARLRRR
jgi:hypothetical protein